MPTPAIVKLPKQTQTTDVTVNYSYDTLTINANQASTGLFISIVPDPVEIPTCTIVKGATGSNQTTISSTVTGAFKFVTVGSVISLKSGSEGSAVLPASCNVISKANDQTIVIDKLTGVTNSATAGATTIISTAPSGNRALMKVDIDLTGINTGSYSPKVNVYYYDGSVTYASANTSNASESFPVTKSINMASFLTKAGIAAVDTNTLDVSS